MNLSVVIPAHNPHSGRLIRTMEGLRSQTLASDIWELIVVDNASTDQTAFELLDLSWHPQARIVRETSLGLTHARLRGFAESNGAIIVLVDDDNVLAPDYLGLVQKAFHGDQKLGALGGRSLPEFEVPPPDWLHEFTGLLALRDPGDQPLRAVWNDETPRIYHRYAPIGAGMAVRREGATAYAKALSLHAHRRSFDRTGTRLVSGGDNDLIMTILEAGLAVAYLPALHLTHMIPKARLQRIYLGALNRAIARSWIGVLALHGIRPWSAVPPATLPLRKLRSWVRSQAWRGPSEWIRWQGYCGHFEGQADLHQTGA
jgi:glycosyltransferase involved in cell wall biosynthesis